MPGLHAEANPDDYASVEDDLVSELRSRAMSHLSGVNSQSDVHVRDILPNEDLESGGANGWGGSNRVWLQGGLSADQLNEAYQIDPSAGSEGKIIGFYAVEAQSSDPPTTEIVFEDDTGSRFERLMFQEAHATGNTQYVTALMRNPVIFNEGKGGNIQQWADSASDDELIYHGVVAEKAGTTLGTRSQGENAPAGVARRPK